jgi:hypothetical protein
LAFRQIRSKRLASAEKQNFHVRASFSEHVGDLGHVHFLCVPQPERLELNLGKASLRELPQICAFLAARKQLGWIVVIHLLRRRLVCLRQPTAVAINTNAAGEGKEPRSKFAPGIKARYGLEGPNEGLLGNFLRIIALPARARNKAKHSISIAMNEFFKREERSGLRLPGQIFVGRRLKFGGHRGKAD